ncbi:hypothetical protein F2Q69_00006248 [Brassica cretica]|uniref:Uncharacterized protein n=1 Tax=Brassica cretica TaxID=69181 RepID=A0A8S9PGW4_BRACR|nr:hypothetical protein F2Q69_00006248 [Brassica cretica]
MAPSRNCFIGDSLIPRIARLRKIWIASLIWSDILSQPGARSLLFRNMPKHDAYVKMAVAHAKPMEANNEFAVTLERRLQDVPHSDELYEIKKLAAAEKLGNQAASLEARFRVVSNERKSALDYLDVLISLKEKWEKKKAASDCEARLKEEVELGSELDVMAVSDFSVGKLDLPQISEDLPEEFFAKVPSEVNEPGEEMKIVSNRIEDGEFDAEEYFQEF